MSDTFDFEENLKDSKITHRINESLGTGRSAIKMKAPLIGEGETIFWGVANVTFKNGKTKVLGNNQIWGDSETALEQTQRFVSVALDGDEDDIDNVEIAICFSVIDDIEVESVYRLIRMNKEEK